MIRMIYNTMLLPAITILMIALHTYGYADQKRPVKVVYTDWFPYTYEQDSAASGFEIEIFREVMSQMGLTPVFFKYPWQRCLLSLKEGEADVLISMLMTPERKEYTFYPGEHISISKTVFFKLKTKQIPYYGSLESLKGYTIGIIMGFSYGETFDKATFLQTDDVLDVRKLIKKILSGRNDLGAENQAVIKANALEMGALNKIETLEPPIHVSRLYAGFSKAKGLSVMCDEFTHQLRLFKQTPNYKAILNRYGIAVSEMAVE